MRTLSKKQQDFDGSAAIASSSPNGLGRTFSALRHRNFRLFWSGQLISLTGTWMQSTGEAWLVLQLTHNAFLLGLVGALQFLPVLLLTLFGGVLADRLPKRKVLLCTQTFALLQAATLSILVATGKIQLWHILVLACLLGLTTSIDNPTRQAFVIEMAGREDLPNAIALNSSLFNMARIVGPGIAGLLIAWLGIAPLYLLNALSFIPVLIGLMMIDMTKLYALPKAVTQGGPNIFQSLGEGLSYVKRTPAVWLTIGVVGIVSLFGINFNVMLPLFATDVLHSGPTGFGFISSTFGIGSLLSALWLAWRNRNPNITQLVIPAIIFAILEGFFALSKLYVLSLVLIAGVGFAQVAFSARANTTLQMVTPDYLRGRIMSVYMMVFAGSTPIGNLLMGELSRQAGAPTAMLVGAVVSLIAASVALILRAPAEKSIAQSTYIS
ncbi:MFS transporter [Ktedonosporobacter rubrisoli]|uniref:MFS transporter n=1 Tax=Ktedonosporobacter rubrisoli TaxID=2509675 RepID=A0A4P6JS17_KTERU|nr:MFS transporter [Ktedonosporobacter rubrisoli]QBD78297.1 MFS transporter [Ktedonosporobacter rubrisoli]